MIAQRAVDGDAAAEQWSGLFTGQGVRDTHNEAGVGAYFSGVSVASMAGQRFSRPRLHHSHSPQELDCQPRPTRCPIFRDLTLEPAAVMVPMISCPGMKGYWLMPQSFEMR